MRVDYNRVMDVITIKEVASPSDLRKFIRFPLDLYKDCRQYVPALDSDQMASLTSCSTARYCQRKMWLAFAGRKVVGRICGIINPRYNELYGTSRARFGWFDVVEDFSVARLLLETAENWASEHGMDEIHGPLYYNTMGKQGMLVEGFENIPPFNCLYNFPYYNGFVERMGYVKECDWLQYKVAIPDELPQKVSRVASRLKERYSLVEADVNALKKDKTLVREFFRIYNASFSQTVHNFVPFTDEEIEEEAKTFIPFLQERLCTFLTTGDGEIVGFGVNTPTISTALQKARGRLLPFGWLHFLRALHSCETVDMMINGAAPAWQNTGVSAVYHAMLLDKLKAAGVKWGITNPQIETNMAVKVWDAYGAEPYMRRRCYLKRIK